MKKPALMQAWSSDNDDLAKLDAFVQSTNARR